MNNNSPKNKIEIRDFEQYVSGWLIASHELSYNNMKGALLNALSMLEDSQDGIDHEVERKNQNII